jgi:potassium-transporting ATPase potassium-binding subunit
MASVLIPLMIIGTSVLLSWPLGKYMHWVMDPGKVAGLRTGYEELRPRILGRFSGEALSWPGYVKSMLVFNALMFLWGCLLLVFQGNLPLNPDGKGAFEWSLAFHTAASFMTNTNLQHYSGEQSASYFSQIFALMWLQFVSAATGIAAVTAVSRALAGRELMGSFYQDLWRATGLILLPLSIIVAFVLILCGSPMTLDGSVVAHTLEGATQTIARGPVAAFVAIKQLGTNGGGFFGPNSSHPYENPTFWSNVLENLCIVVIPMATVWMFGRITNRLRHAAIIFAVMLSLYLAFVALAGYFESEPTAALANLHVKPGINLEGKELRFGGQAGSLWAVSTTATSNGSVNAMHDSLNPLTSLLPLAGMWLSVVFGGVGVGLINMFIFIIIAVFIAGLMVGRTPEYLTRKVEAKEMKLAVLAMLVHPLFILGGTAVFAATAWGQQTTHNPGSHGLTEIFYEFSSAAANNGSGFEGLRDNTVPWNVVTGCVMILARFIPIVAPLIIAGSLARKRSTPESGGTLRVDTPLFAAILLSTVLIVGALLFLPLAVLGPIAEQLGVGR